MGRAFSTPTPCATVHRVMSRKGQDERVDGTAIGAAAAAPEASPFRERGRPTEATVGEQKPDPVGFREGAAAPVDRERLLETRIKDLRLHIAGTKVEPMLSQLYRELDQAGISFKPPAYLSDEWGCPEARPLIGIPFYLADEKLGAIEGEVNEARETERESLMYLRHEAGHAFC